MGWALLVSCPKLVAVVIKTAWFKHVIVLVCGLWRMIAPTTSAKSAGGGDGSRPLTTSLFMYCVLTCVPIPLFFFFSDAGTIDPS